MNEKGSNHQQLKLNNYHLIKKYIYQHSPISRVEIAQKLGLTTPTITGMVNPMIAGGLLRETMVESCNEEKRAGRPRVMLEYVPDAYYVCGVDVGPYQINYVLTDLCGHVVDTLHTDDKLDEYDTTLELLSKQIPGFIARTGVPKGKILGVGICLPGLIDGSVGKIYTTFHEGWVHHNLAAELEQRLGLRVATENNVRARAIGADLFVREVKQEPFAYFYVSFGVACQFIIDGKALYGQSAAAGEIGHTVVQRGGPVCPTCGNRGCLEALAGERAILQRCREIMQTDDKTALWTFCGVPKALTMEHVLKAQETGDEPVNLVMEDVIDYLGIALANTINVVSPSTVVLDAKIFMAPRNQDLMMHAVRRNMFRVHVDKTQFEFLPYDPDRGARGAAAVVVKDFLQSGE